jgi:hypothetical protein
MDRVKINLYSLILMHQRDVNSTRDIRADNFLYDWWTRHELNTKLAGEVEGSDPFN